MIIHDLVTGTKGLFTSRLCGPEWLLLYIRECAFTSAFTIRQYLLSVPAHTHSHPPMMRKQQFFIFTIHWWERSSISVQDAWKMPSCRTHSRAMMKKEYPMYAVTQYQTISQIMCTSIKYGANLSHVRHAGFNWCSTFCLPDTTEPDTVVTLFIGEVKLNKWRKKWPLYCTCGK